MPKAHRAKKTRCYTDEFKSTAVELSLAEGVQVQTVAGALDIHPFGMSGSQTISRKGRWNQFCASPVCADGERHNWVGGRMKHISIRGLRAFGIAVTTTMLVACGGQSATSALDAEYRNAAEACGWRLADGSTTIKLIGDDTCWSCANSNLANVIDNDPETSGRISITGPNDNPESGIGVLITAQEGVVLPGGSQAVIVGSFPTVDFVGSVYIKTLLDGEVMDEGNAEAHVLGGYIGTGTPSKRTFTLGTSNPFNQVEVTLSNTGLGDASAGGQTVYYPDAVTSTLDIFEVCSSLPPQLSAD